MFASLNGAIKIAAQSNKAKAAALVKWFIKRSVEKIQEDNHNTIGAN